MKIYAVVPARSGSKGLPDKNIKLLNAKPLIAYSIEAAHKIGCDRVICSTDSQEYAAIAKQYGAEVPFLRSAFAAADTAMEEHILEDFAAKFVEHGIDMPDLIVWLRPTFVFRDIEKIKECIAVLKANPEYTSARLVCESEGRLYRLDQNSMLYPCFDDKGKSMIRRQDVGHFYKVFSTDIIRFNPPNYSDDFLGKRVYGKVVNKICGLDIDDEFDFRLVESILHNNFELVREYI